MRSATANLANAGVAGASIVLSAAGQLGMKAGMHTLAAAQALSAPTTGPAWGALLWTGLGLFCYGLSMLAWLAALARYPLSQIYPLLGLSYVLVYLGATHWAYLAEPASIGRGLGTALIAVGVVIVCSSRSR
jgi:undecaprenyl phosphate-alpha-L-ara4N flippase subunit ArnF